LADRMDRPLPPRAPRQRHVEPFGLEPLVQRRIGQRRLLGAERRVDLVLQPVQRGTGGLPHLGRHLAKLAHLQADLALLAERRQPSLPSSATGISPTAAPSPPPYLPSTSRPFSASNPSISPSGPLRTLCYPCRPPIVRRQEKTPRRRSGTRGVLLSLGERNY